MFDIPIFLFLCFPLSSCPSLQPHKNVIIEGLWRTLALLLQRMREGIKSFDWVKAPPDVVDNYNDTYHKTLRAKPIEVLEGKKENPVEKRGCGKCFEKGNESQNQNKENSLLERRRGNILSRHLSNH